MDVILSLSLSSLVYKESSVIPDVIHLFAPELLELQYLEITLQYWQYVSVLQVAIHHLFYLLAVVFVIQSQGDLLVLLGYEVQVRIGQFIRLHILFEVSELALLEVAIGNIVHLEDLLLVMVFQLQ